MPKYLCLQRNLNPAAPNTCASSAPTGASSAEMQAMYDKFRAWQEQFKDNIVDLGGKVGEGKLITDTAPDGPFIEVKELIGGYMILAADNLEAATEVARAIPGLVSPGSGFEIVEIFSS